jgi:hypothetical protein
MLWRDERLVDCGREIGILSGSFVSKKKVPKRRSIAVKKNKTSVLFAVVRAGGAVRLRRVHGNVKFVGSLHTQKPGHHWNLRPRQ